MTDTSYSDGGWNDLAVNGGQPVRSGPITALPVLGDDELHAVRDVLESQRLTQFTSSKVAEFERAFAEFYGVRHAIAVNSGTAALHVALEAVGVGREDEVIVSPFSFIASVSAVLHANAVPVFADIDPKTYCIDPADVERKVTTWTRAILPVHIFGQPADMNPILTIAARHRLAVVEDAAQAHDSRYRSQLAGTMGDAGCFSFYDSKNMTTGEGGMIVTKEDDVAEQCRLIRHHGESASYVYERVGYNYRMTAVQAALGIVQLGKLKEFNNLRRQHAAFYDETLAGMPITLPQSDSRNHYTTHVYTMLLPEELSPYRDEIVEALRAENVYVSVCYPSTIHLSTLFQNTPHTYSPGLCPVAENVAARCFTLPVHHALTPDDVKDIAAAVQKVVPAFLKKYT